MRWSLTSIVAVIVASCFYTNPRLRARVLPARSEMRTTLIAQISDLLAPISKCTTQSTYTNGSVRGISLV
jgi:uncharacterized membrane protein YraQ (UPF0718 family)